MNAAPHCVWADDITGAAEIAGIAYRFGHQSRLFLKATSSETAPGAVAVTNLDTRLLAAHRAAQKITEFAAQSTPSPRGLFIKVDSVLRGPVRAQIEALAETVGARRVILAPANPERGRVIVDDTYRVNGQLLHQTQFARDPHHPARSSRPRDLLGDGALPLRVCRVGEALPPRGIIVAEASERGDLDWWAAQCDAATLAVGAAEFFRARLRAAGACAVPRAQPPVLRQGLLWICGSTMSPSRALFATQWRDVTHYLPAEKEQLAQTLARRGFAVLCSAPTAGDARQIQREIAELVVPLVREGAASHLLIEGGATAGGIMEALGQEFLETRGEIDTGIVAFSPPRSDFMITLKPGSYEWPPGVLSF